MICRHGKPFCPFSLALIGAGWFVVALFVGETELLANLPGPAAQLTLAGLTGGLLAAYFTSRSLRDWVEQLDLKFLIGMHLTRWVGVYFLVLHGRGELPSRFALTAGWGDIVVATGAVWLLLMPAARNSARAVLAWNVVGLIDILLVVTTAASLAFADRESMSALTRLPLSFLPTMIVPLIISTHVFMMLRLFRRAPRAALDTNEAPVLSA